MVNERDVANIHAFRDLYKLEKVAMTPPRTPRYTTGSRSLRMSTILPAPLVKDELQEKDVVWCCIVLCDRVCRSESSKVKGTL